MRRTTREEAVARIKDHIEIHRYHEQTAVKIFEALDMAIKALEQSEQQWIPIKEGPPKKEGSYLVQSKYIEMPFIAWFGIDPRYPRGNNNCVQKFWCDDYKDDLMPLDDVIAWMPLPEPYKENTE